MFIVFNCKVLVKGNDFTLDLYNHIIQQDHNSNVPNYVSKWMWIQIPCFP